MIKRSLYLVAMLITFIALASCQKNVEATTQLEEKESRHGLDVLKDYDKDLWVGPDGWSEQQWAWKTLLKWDRECDYIADVHTHSLSAQYELITVQCIPGAYQAMYYLFLLDNITKESIQLALGHSDNTDNPQEIFGTINVDTVNKGLSILTLSRGLADCGIYREFDFIDGPDLKNTLFQLKNFRRQICNNRLPEDVENLPKALFDYKNWPHATEK